MAADSPTGDDVGGVLGQKTRGVGVGGVDDFTGAERASGGVDRVSFAFGGDGRNGGVGLDV